MKKSQMEIMGIAIIVVLLSLAFLFAVKFVILKEPTEQSKDYQQSELAGNFINALLDTNDPQCSDIKYSTLFQACYENDNGPCSPLNTCDHIESRIEQILADTFNQWNVNYFFMVTTNIDDLNPIPNLDPIPLSGPNTLEEVCKGNRKVKIQPLPTNTPGQSIYLKLFICD